MWHIEQSSHPGVSSSSKLFCYKWVVRTNFHFGLIGKKCCSKTVVSLQLFDLDQTSLQRWSTCDKGCEYGRLFPWFQPDVSIAGSFAIRSKTVFLNISLSDSFCVFARIHISFFKSCIQNNLCPKTIYKNKHQRLRICAFALGFDAKFQYWSTKKSTTV